MASTKPTSTQSKSRNEIYRDMENQLLVLGSWFLALKLLSSYAPGLSDHCAPITAHCFTAIPALPSPAAAASLRRSARSVRLAISRLLDCPRPESSTPRRLPLSYRLPPPWSAAFAVCPRRP